MTSPARSPRRSPSPWLVGALVAGAAAWARHRGAISWPPAQAPTFGPHTGTHNATHTPALPSAPSPSRLAEIEATAAFDRQRLAQMQHELEHLVKVRLPAALAGRDVPGARYTADLLPEASTTIDDLLSQVTSALVEREESRRLALVELAGRVQTSAHRIQQAMSGLAEQHPGDPALLETTMRVDHAATQQARHAQSVKVLCDEWPGQQWPAALALVDVVRAASGRIVAFGRVQVTGDQTAAVVPSVVEPLIHLVAELLANATEYSAPSAPVAVSVRGVQRGAVIEIDDSGFGLDEYRLAQAREIVSGRRLLGVGDVGEIPQTGFAVVGRFARRHGFTVDLGISPYGGVRAVVLVPAALVETVELPAPASVRDPKPAAEPEPAPPEAPATPKLIDTRVAPAVGLASAEDLFGSGDGSEVRLPQRRSARRKDAGRSGGETAAGRPRPVVPSAPEVAPEEAGDWMERFFEGSQPIPVTPVAPAGADPTENPSPEPTSTPTTHDFDLEGNVKPSTAGKDAAQG
ncbi:ATP-binding protein [Kineosporia sp. NBRC 101731]|uniref:ATP-binding protein n=1 Tax=Kineosporia sp. NBRC 101731 TaxID=3032199 RepID=UPI0024A2D417|nr:ATP-binding protein [Kineosporia sp. NBRC 101731]GLY33218.1 hypothetical protein Kisp02_65830 [Kineosporia sp. NBRC 101731]